MVKLLVAKKKEEKQQETKVYIFMINFEGFSFMTATFVVEKIVKKALFWVLQLLQKVRGPEWLQEQEVFQFFLLLSNKKNFSHSFIC